jgi:hypothetical protein
MANIILAHMLAKRPHNENFCVGAFHSNVDIAALKRRFGTNILPLNACRMNPMGAVVVTQSGEQAEELTIRMSVCSMIGSRCYVDVSAVYGNLGGNGYLYTLERSGGAWSVQNVRNTWIS